MWGNIPLWFWFAFPWLVMLNTFSCFHVPVGYFVSLLLKKICIQGLCLFFFFLLSNSISSLYILDINTLSDGWFQIFYHSIGCLSFSWLFLLLCSIFIFLFSIVPLVYFWFYSLRFWCYRQKLVAKTNVRKLFSYIFW